MAIMGFGGGAMIASPLSQLLLDHYKSPTSVGVAETFVTLGVIYLVAMLSGAFLFRVPAPGWQPAGLAATRRRAEPRRSITRRHVHVDQAIKTRAVLVPLGGAVPQRHARASGSWSRPRR